MIEVLVYWIQDEIVGRRSASSSSLATSLMDDTSPESAVGKKSELGTIYSIYIPVTAQSLFLLLFLVRRSWTLIRSSILLFFQKLHPCSCPFPLHPSQRGVRPRRGDTQSRRKLRPTSDSFSHPPNKAPSRWWVRCLFKYCTSSLEEICHSMSSIYFTARILFVTTYECVTTQ